MYILYGWAKKVVETKVWCYDDDASAATATAAAVWKPWFIACYQRPRCKTLQSKCSVLCWNLMQNNHTENLGITYEMKVRKRRRVFMALKLSRTVVFLHLVEINVFKLESLLARRTTQLHLIANVRFCTLFKFMHIVVCVRCTLCTRKFVVPTNPSFLLLLCQN